MSKISIKGADTGTGVFTLESPATNTDRTLVLPDEAGTVLTTATPGVPVNGPAFSAYQNSATAISAWTKILYQVEDYDTNDNFASSRFTPTVAGYYQISSTTSIVSPALCVSAIYKNGSEFKRGGYSNSSNVSGGYVSSLIYLNGSTDYVEIYTYSTSSVNTSAAQSDTWVTGFLARGV